MTTKLSLDREGLTNPRAVGGLLSCRWLDIRLWPFARRIPMDVRFERTGERRYGVFVDRTTYPSVEMNPAPS